MYILNIENDNLYLNEAIDELEKTKKQNCFIEFFIQKPIKK